ncbi:MAG TPA: hypothetical protein VD907_01035 [Verrucomicrobiae bacterium]|nr:hypothetical protein [Verrucomicrobiae bacterium]
MTKAFQIPKTVVEVKVELGKYVFSQKQQPSGMVRSGPNYVELGTLIIKRYNRQLKALAEIAQRAEAARNPSASVRSELARNVKGAANFLATVKEPYIREMFTHGFRLNGQGLERFLLLVQDVSSSAHQPD